MDKKDPDLDHLFWLVPLLLTVFYYLMWFHVLIMP